LPRVPSARTYKLTTGHNWPSVVLSHTSQSKKLSLGVEEQELGFVGLTRDAAKTWPPAVVPLQRQLGQCALHRIPGGGRGHIGYHLPRLTGDEVHHRWHDHGLHPQVSAAAQLPSGHALMLHSTNKNTGSVQVAGPPFKARWLSLAPSSSDPT